MLDEIGDLVNGAVREVFKTMLGAAVQEDSSVADLRWGESHVAAAVGFVGPVTGVVYIYCSEPFAKVITSRLLSISENEIDGDEMVNDALGEMANMTAGQLKSRLSDQGLECVMTLPSIVRGTHFTVQTLSNTERSIRYFRCEQQQPFAIEVLVKHETEKN